MAAENVAGDTQAVLETAMEAGHILLQNGAEISRVEETMERIARHYGVTTGDFFVLSNGIFTTGMAHGTGFARVEHIPVRGAQLHRVVAVNQLSREIAEGEMPLEEVRTRLAAIRTMPGRPKAVQILASAVGSASFCVLFGGGAWDAAAAFCCGLLLYLFVLTVSEPHLSKLVGSIAGGALVTLICLACYSVGLGRSLSHMVIGSIIPLVPGVSFTNGIRDIADGDYLSGAVRLLDAGMVFLGVAIGVGFAFTMVHRLLGGALL